MKILHFSFKVENQITAIFCHLELITCLQHCIEKGNMMAKLPSSNKLSILTPTHILEDYLADCEGIANVSYYNFPIILPFALSLSLSNDRTILINQWFLIAKWERYWFGKFNNLWLIETTILKNFISDDIKVSSTCSHLYIFSNCLTLKCYKIQVLFIFFRDWYLFVLVETSHEKKMEETFCL